MRNTVINECSVGHACYCYIPSSHVLLYIILHLFFIFGIVIPTSYSCSIDFSLHIPANVMFVCGPPPFFGFAARDQVKPHMHKEIAFKILL